MARKGKYAGVVDRLPKYVGEDDSYQSKVELRKAALLKEIPMESSSLVRAFCMARKEKEANEKIEFEINLTLEALKQMIADRFEVEGTSSVSLDSGQTVRVQLEPHARVVDKRANRLWAMANGLEEHLSLPWQTLNSITKELLLKGEAEPEGVVAYTQSKVFLTGAGE